jgi:hypothetical protein
VEFTCGGWQNTPGMCLLECVLLIECVLHILGGRRIRLICVFLCGETRTRRVLDVWGVWRRILGMCLFSTFTRGRTEHARGSKLDGTYSPPFFSFFFSRRC